MHHVEPVGVSAFGFDNFWKDRGQTVPFAITQHPDKFREIWREYAGRWAKFGPQVIWQLGLRGIADRPVWMADPGVPKSDEGRGKLISDAMATQWEIIRSVDPRPATAGDDDVVDGRRGAARRGTPEIPAGRGGDLLGQQSGLGTAERFSHGRARAGPALRHLLSSSTLGQRPAPGAGRLATEDARDFQVGGRTRLDALRHAERVQRPRVRARHRRQRADAARFPGL